MLLTSSWMADSLILVILALIGGHAYHLFLNRRWMLLDPLNTFWAGILVCYVGQPLSAGDILLSWHSPSIFNQTLFATLVGLIAVVLGYESAVGGRLARKTPRLPPRLHRDRLFVAAIFLLTAGLLGYAYIIERSGGWAEWIDMSRGGTDYERVQGYLPELAHGIPAGLFLLFARAQFCRVSWMGKAVAWAGAALMLYWFLYLGSRSRFIMAMILILSAFYLPRNRSPGLWITSALFLVTLLVTNMQQSFRGNFRNMSFNLHLVDSAEFWGKVLPLPFGNSELKRSETSAGLEFNCAMAVVELVPKRVPYNYGYGFLELFTRPIPRALWPNKIYPHMQSVQGVLREAGLSESPVSSVQKTELLMGPAFAFVGHWYYVGGYLALVLGGYLTGALFRFIRALYDLAPGSQSIVLVYPFLLSIGFGEAASTPWYWFYSLPFVVLPFIAVIYLSQERSPMTPARRRMSRLAVPESVPGLGSPETCSANLVPGSSACCPTPAGRALRRAALSNLPSRKPWPLVKRPMVRPSRRLRH